MSMDKNLLKAYIRTIVEEEVTRILPKMLSEAVQQVKQLSETTNTVPTHREPPKFSKTQLAEMMGLAYDGETLRADGPITPTTKPGDPDIHRVITRDYSQLMKKMGLT
jgi:hypothetical protein